MYFLAKGSTSHGSCSFLGFLPKDVVLSTAGRFEAATPGSGVLAEPSVGSAVPSVGSAVLLLVFTSKAGCKEFACGFLASSGASAILRRLSTIYATNLQREPNGPVVACHPHPHSLSSFNRDSTEIDNQ
eukprot:m.423671 g.423671  ORF g.423671 m.423671 type:complete len:129 (+) comp16856_c0_seq4:2801-3187(+)